MQSFREYAILQEQVDYFTAIKILEDTDGILSEGLLDSLTKSVKQKISFIKKIVELTKNKLKDMLVFFKDKIVFEFFKALKFSISKIVDMYKLGVKTFHSIEDILVKKVIELGGVKYIHKHLKELDEFFKSHPVLKKIGGIAVAGLLIWIWLSMSYSPPLSGADITWSLSWGDMINALQGNFSLADLFATDAGVKMLIYLVIGLLGGGVPYPRTKGIQILSGIVIGLYQNYYKGPKIHFENFKPVLKKIKAKS